MEKNGKPTEWITVKWSEMHQCWNLVSLAGKTKENALRVLERDRKRYPGEKLDIEEVISEDQWWNSPWGCD